MFPQLLPYLADNKKAGDYFEAQRWPNEVVCPYCQGQEIEKRERSGNGLQRYSCLLCAQAKGQQYRMFTVWSESIYEKSKLSPSLWLWVIAFWQLKLNSTEIALAVGINEQSAARCVNLLDGSVYESHHLDPDRQLNGQVEADECYQTAGHKGQPRRVAQEERPARRRVLKRRGRATAAQGRPPILGLVQRPDEEDQAVAQVYLEVLPNVQTDTIKPIILAKVHPQSQLLTDEYAIYNFTAEVGYDHRSVNHSQGEYVRSDPDGTLVHCNTMEGVWTGLRTFLRRFAGVSQKYLHLRVARYEFLHNHRHLDLLDLFQSALQHSFNATAGYWRQMVKKHRRIPLTLCYR